jgi:hypothetical protein
MSRLAHSSTQLSLQVHALAQMRACISKQIPVSAKGLRWGIADSCNKLLAPHTMLGSRSTRLTLPSFPATTDTAAPNVTVALGSTVAPFGLTTLVVNWTTSVIDDRTLGLGVTCTPDSGSVFTVGSAVTVSCSATDAGGNVGWNNFTVTAIGERPGVKNRYSVHMSCKTCMYSCHV